MKISLRIDLIIVFFALLALSASSAFIYQSVKNTAIETQGVQQSLIARNMISQIDISLREKLISAQSLSERDQVRKILTAGFAPDAATVKNLDNQLREFTLIYSTWDDISILDANGEVVSSSRNDFLGKFLTAGDPTQAALLKKALNGEATFSDVFYSRMTNRPTVAFYAPIYKDFNNTEIVGAVEGDLSWYSVLDTLKDAHGSEVYLINRDGIEIGTNYFEKDKGKILSENYSDNPTFQRIKAGIVTAEIMPDLDTKTEAFVSAAFEPGYLDYRGNGWILVIETKSAGILALARSNTQNMAIIFIIVVLIAAISASYFINRFISRPIEEFTKAVSGVSGGAFPEVVARDGNEINEISELEKAFNLMVGRVRDAKENLEQKIREKTRQLEDELTEKEYQNKILEDTKKSVLNLLDDISREKIESDKLVVELSKFHLTVDNSYEHIIFTDSDGVIIYANKAAERLTGYPLAEIIGKRPSLWGNQMSREFYRGMWDTIKNKKRVFGGEIINRRKNGQLYTVDAHIFPITDRITQSYAIGSENYSGSDSGGEIKFFVGMERDITEQKKLEEARINFVSVASHQLRTPITAIKWIVELLMGGNMGTLNKEQADLMGDLSSSVSRMIKLINGLLNIARIESQNLIVAPEPVNLKMIYDDVLKELESAAETKSQKFIFTDESGLDSFITDRHLFFEVLKNLLSNSIKYTPEGGIIETRFTVRDSGLVCSVKDNGIGIPKNQQDRIFEKFFRADNAVEKTTDGTGLGMYIVKSLVGLLEGRIWFESEENKGTTMHVYLPLGGPKPIEGSKNIVSS